MAEYLKIPEVAQRLDVSEKTARRMVKGGKLPSVFIGGAYRVSEEDLERYVEAAKVRPGDGSGKAQASTPPEESGLPREESIFDLVHNAVIEEDKRSRQATARADESRRPQSRFMRFEDEALVRLLERYPDEVADSYIDLMRSYVQLEAEKAELEERLRAEKAGSETV